MNNLNNSVDGENDVNWPEKERRRETVVRLSRQDMDELVKKIREANAESIAEALNSALTDDVAVRFWSAGLRAIQTHAAEHTGRFILGGVWAVAQKLLLFVTIGSLIYAIGGWAALAKLWHAFFGANP